MNTPLRHLSGKEVRVQVAASSSVGLRMLGRQGNGRRDGMNPVSKRRQSGDEDGCRASMSPQELQEQSDRGNNNRKAPHYEGKAENSPMM